MEIPEQIKICGIPYSIEVREMEDYGECYLETCKIYIKEDMPKHLEKRTLLHEIYHVIWAYRLKYSNEMAPNLAADTLEHLFVDMFANSTMELLENNKELAEYLIF